MIAYYRAVWRTAFRDARTFWTAHKIVTTLPAPTIAFLLSAFFKGLSSRLEIMYALIISALSFLASLGLTFLVSLVRAPKLLDDENQAAIRLSNEQNTRQASELAILNQKIAKPPRTAAEQYRYDLAKTAIKKLGQEAELILRHLQVHGKIILGSWFIPTLPSEMSAEKAKRVLNALKQEHIVNETFTPSPGGCDSVWEIAPGMAAALDELLYEGN